MKRTEKLIEDETRIKGKYLDEFYLVFVEQFCTLSRFDNVCLLISQWKLLVSKRSQP